MEPENHSHPQDTPVSPVTTQMIAADEPLTLPEPATPHFSVPPGPSIMQRIFIGDQGLRAGWSILVFIILLGVIGGIAGILLSLFHLGARPGQLGVRGVLFTESIQFLGLLGAAWIVALIERRSILDFNLAGQRRTFNFFVGLAAGFLVLSALVGSLSAGGWLDFGPVALSGLGVAKYAALWGVAFLLVGCFEEGMFRCYLQFTMTRGINFWWAVGIEAAICASLALHARGTGAWGVYAMALVGLAPCLILHLKRGTNSGFWQAAWVTSTLFGFVHTGNSGENWIGIFAAGAIGFVFCVSIWLTGSAWWAIGCHAGWDWGETYFYGTADSGMVSPGHYLSTSPVGSTFWSGGTNGPEGSILVLGAILLLLILLSVFYRRKPDVLDA